MTVSAQVNHLLRDASGLPVDPFGLAHTVGLDVVHANKGPDFYNPQMKIVSVQHGQSERVQRFAAAFLLAHHALNIGAVQIGASTFKSSNPDPNQRRALQFALELLVPTFALRSAVEDKGVTDLEQLAKAFNVSSAAVSVRLRQLDLVQSSGLSFSP